MVYENSTVLGQGMLLNELHYMQDPAKLCYFLNYLLRVSMKYGQAIPGLLVTSRACGGCNIFIVCIYVCVCFCVCLFVFVCVSVRAVSFEGVDIETSFLI